MKLAIDYKLIEQAKNLGSHRTGKEAVIVAVEEYVQSRRQQEIVPAFGTIDYDENYDYKGERRAKRRGGERASTSALRCQR